MQGVLFMAKSSLSSQTIEEVKNYERVLRAHGIKVEKLVVFGSQAKGKAKSWSDIDLCVVSPQFGKNRFEERVRLMKLSIGAGENIEPHPYNAKDLGNKWDSLASEINKYGIEISL